LALAFVLAFAFSFAAALALCRRAGGGFTGPPFGKMVLAAKFFSRVDVGSLDYPPYQHKKGHVVSKIWAGLMRVSKPKPSTALGSMKYEALRVLGHVKEKRVGAPTFLWLDEKVVPAPTLT